MNKFIILLLILSSQAFAGNYAIYSNDEFGNPLGGDKQFLIDEAMTGVKVFVRVNVNGEALYTGELIQVHEGELCMMVVLNAINIKSESDFFTPYSPYGANFCTNGVEYVRHGNGKLYMNRMEMVWYLGE